MRSIADVISSLKPKLANTATSSYVTLSNKNSGMSEFASMLDMQKLFHAALNNQYATEHCAIASISGNKLLVKADSPTWGAYLRYNQSSILAHLTKHSYFSRVRILEISIDMQL